jgi:hypothetical protein
MEQQCNGRLQDGNTLQKLQAWEYAALTLETGGDLNVLHSLDFRSGLLGKYNMLCLPGTPVHLWLQ